VAPSPVPAAPGTSTKVDDTSSANSSDPGSVASSTSVSSPSFRAACSRSRASWLATGTSSGSSVVRTQSTLKMTGFTCSRLLRDVGHVAWHTVGYQAALRLPSFPMFMQYPMARSSSCSRVRSEQATPPGSPAVTTKSTWGDSSGTNVGAGGSGGTGVMFKPSLPLDIPVSSWASTKADWDTNAAMSKILRITRLP